MSPATTTSPLTLLIARFVTAYMHDFLTAAEGHGLTLTQAKLLLALNEPPGEQPMRALAAQLACDPSNLTGVADRMEARGLVRRTVNPSDRRVKYLAATEEGRELAAGIRAAQVRAYKALAELTADEETLLAGMLERLVPKLEARED
ncbi:MarR family winged helix-turn-helix transcriptional regulator [Nocardia pseudobrasiliensis]|uniref:DNA-binding MarR family transcriptional regulator n=1 Tax=Nocardia pseudobrasiliensis TaxID=45979 RepID=A0A370HZR9_9NOCA|nr:MarR family transcriptional regulator [Nocardia pseudobrasiliensis]RDI63820.1 DNA-binding MarR family transcriptional regulator [Nocardia pseudobrasiliensis]